MKQVATILFLSLWLCLFALSSWAAVYVSDSLEAPMRSGPGTEYKIVSVLRSGQPVEVISEQDGWSSVRTVDRGNKEGWILSRYLMNREPWGKRVKTLEEENENLRSRLSTIQDDLRDVKVNNADLSKTLGEKTSELETLQKTYEYFKKDASDFIDLKEKFENIQSDLIIATDELAKVKGENNILRSSNTNRWFLSGALVLLFGLIIGMIVGRREKRRSKLSLR